MGNLGFWPQSQRAVVACTESLFSRSLCHRHDASPLFVLLSAPSPIRDTAMILLFFLTDDQGGGTKPVCCSYQFQAYAQLAPLGNVFDTF